MSSARERLLGEVIGYFARHGVSDHSLRGLAAAVGTSHRMLIYHFGTREGLLAEVVRVVEGHQRDTFAALTATEDADPRTAARRFWSLVVGPALRYGPLFFELSAHAMQGQPHATPLRTSLVEPWLEPLTDLLTRAGQDRDTAATHARLGLAVARGLLHDLLLTGDREAADAAMDAWIDLVLTPAPRSPAR
ncbi:TetR/AcrR family transcriptional regulator [Actinophytocola gossypii]|uniref:TetR/AcrR family transcriptional regulator n=1 Tax=Actinophytocola gossypii TaxID=2812003 RepID=A0ABT2JCG3_9PSEU|nr:TetR/AcrR family transcriptional regulator [Actinophytocola gossypii]MCT2585555.1 TetR/AcrR family transcriptional regulator [Actinophytocola gossypii]